jgi:hypothetical protein
MTDRIVIKTWWLLTLTLVGVTAIGCVLTAYRVLFEVVSAHWSTAGGCATASLVLGASSCLLCKYRGDLVGD